MTLTDWILTVLGLIALIWISALVFVGGLIVIAILSNNEDEPDPQAEPEHQVLFAEAYERDFISMKAAVAGAYRETVPGPCDASLDTCFAIWPDAPVHPGEDGTS